ncbi:MAG: AraC family transcriptional regulator [Arenicella sp.]
MHKHANRINHVLNFAHLHCDKNIDLDLLAGLACLSKYHFIKVFTDYVGETPINFLNRIRLERAARLLSYHRDMKITDTALNCGYSSVQVFSRAFSDKFDINPREFKSTYIYQLPYLSASDINSQSSQNDYLNQVEQRLSLDNSPIRIIQQPAIKVAYVRSISNYGISSDINTAVDSINYWAHKHCFLTKDTKVIGVSWDDDQLAPRTACKYDACIQVPNNFPINSDISVQVIPGGLYATFSAPCYSTGDLPYIWRHFTKRLANSSKHESRPLQPGMGYEMFRENALDGTLYVDLYCPWHVM